jgi:hypothetical protein
MRDRRDLIQLCVERGGYRKGAPVAEFVMEWEIAVRKHAGSITIEEFGRWWKDSTRTAYRRLDAFRELFPELGPIATPEALMRPLLDRLALEADPAYELLDAIPLELALVAA